MLATIGARQIMNYYMKHSNSGDVKIYSKKEMLLLLSKDFHEIEWKSFGTRSCLIIAYNNKPQERKENNAYFKRTRGT